MDGEQYYRHGGRYVLRRGAWVRLLAAGLISVALLTLAVYFLLPHRSPAVAGSQLQRQDKPADTSTPAMSAPDTELSTVPAGNAPNAVELTPQQIVQAGTLVLVNQHSLWPQGYEPQLITLAEHRPPNLVGLKSLEMRADPTAFAALVELLQAAQQDGVTGFLVVSSYRGYDKQKALFDARVQELMQGGKERQAAVDRADDTVAWPGQSEHHTGLAFDIVSQNSNGTLEAFNHSPQCIWMKGHCSQYGFIMRYPEDKKDITGIDNEPWHYRYVGREHAEKMEELGVCLEEYVEYLRGK